MRKDFLVFGSPLIERPEIDEVVATLESGWIGTGPKTHKFEEEFKKYVGTEHAVALNSCTAALHLSLKVLGVGLGDEVIVPAMTFAATANTVIHCGATPVFADIDRETQNIDSEDIERKITSKTKAIVVVHMAGRPCEMDRIMHIAKEHNLKVVEDAAHAVEAEYHGKKIGSIGDIGCFSFYVTKNVVTAEGGMAVTNDEAYAKRMRILSLHGLSADAWNRYGSSGYKHYEVVEAGYKYNMIDMNASLGLHQLARVEVYAQRRVEIWNMYNEMLRNLPILLPAEIPSDVRHARHLYAISVESGSGITRDQFIEEMKKRNIGTGVHFRALHTQPFYRNLLGHKPEDFPNATWVGEHTVSLPFSAKLTDDDVRDVVEAVRDVLGTD